jgi:hypothetical protein
MSSKQIDNRQNAALFRVLQVSSTISARAITLTLSLLGLAFLIPEIHLPPQLAAVAGSVGIEAMGNLLDYVAKKDNISDEEIKCKLNELIDQVGVDNLLTKDDFYHAFAHIRKGQHLLSSQNEVMLATLRNLEDIISMNSIAITHDLERTLAKRWEHILFLKLGITFRNYWFIAKVFYCASRNDITQRGYERFQRSKHQLTDLVNTLGFEIFIPENPQQFNVAFDTKLFWSVAP